MKRFIQAFALVKSNRNLSPIAIIVTILIVQFASSEGYTQNSKSIKVMDIQHGNSAVILQKTDIVKKGVMHSKNDQSNSFVTNPLPTWTPSSKKDREKPYFKSYNPMTGEETFHEIQTSHNSPNSDFSK